MRFGILGGTFNPIHFGHLRAAEEVSDKINLDRVIFVPSGNPPFKTSDLMDSSHRYEMTGISIDSNAKFVISDLEMRQGEKSYAINTIERLSGIYPDDELFFILGIDAFLDIPNWWKSDALTEMIDFVVVTREGFDLADIMKSPYIDAKGSNRYESDNNNKNGCYFLSPVCNLKSGKRVIPVQVTALNISSTEIRRLIKVGKSIKYLLPEVVEQYIYGNNLYR